MRARNSHFIEEQLGGVLAALADFVENLAAPESRPVSLDNDQRDARSALARICLGNNDDGSACWPLVMKVLEPVITYSSPSRRAFVLTLCRSDPVPGSVMAIAPIISPDAILGSHCARSSSVAYCRM